MSCSEDQELIEPPHKQRKLDETVLPPSAAGVRIIQVTDVYTLENFPSLKTMIAEKKAEALSAHMDTVSMLTGDFLAPYLLSSIDRGKGMMQMLNETPIDYLTWGNHDGNDMAPDAVKEREAEYQGVWINSNMKGHETFECSKCQVDRAMLELHSADGSNERKIGLCAVLSNSKDLYRPNAFNGAKIEDPWETLREYKRLLEKEDECDLVIPLCHLYEPQDEKTCREFDFPLILSGHDHHVVDKVCEGTRLLKPGQDARKAYIVDIKWASNSQECKPTFEVEIVDVTKYPKDPQLLAKSQDAYKVLDRLSNTELCAVEDKYRPLTSFGSRNRHVTMGTFLCNKIRDALNASDTRDGNHHVDSVIMKGANVRGGTDYPDNSKFTLKALLSETQEEHEIFVFKVPGSCIKVGLRETWQQAGPGWFQYSNDVVVNDEGLVTHIAGEALDEDRLYVIGSIKDLARAADGPTIGNYLSADKSRIPSPDSGHPLRPLLLGYFAEVAWKKMFKAMDKDGDGSIDKQELQAWDENGDGVLDKHELKTLLRSSSGLITVEEEDTFIDVLIDAAGGHDGKLTLQEINASEPFKRQTSTESNTGRTHVRKSIRKSLDKGIETDASQQRP